MPQIRLLVSVAGERGAVMGDAGTVLTVDNLTARKWCDGERAERVIDRNVVVETTAAPVKRPVGRPPLNRAG